jgi:predicted DNA-binding ribbon-helix-helix protein
MLTSRRLRFAHLLTQANRQPTDWLIATLQDKTHNNGYFTPLARLACLRTLMFRVQNGMCYLDKKRYVRREFGI